MRKTVDKQIGERGYVYHVTQFGAREGGRVLVRLLKMIGGAAGAAVASEQDFDMQTVGKIISNLAESVSEQDFDTLVETFMKTTEVSGGTYNTRAPLTTEGLFDLHFAGAYDELGQWLLFAIEANFGGSFLGKSGFVQKAKAAAGARQASGAKMGSESRSRSLSTSEANGLSGE
jgi:hypothetical protein